MVDEQGLITFKSNLSVGVLLCSAKIYLFVLLILFKLIPVFVVALGISTKYPSIVASVLNCLSLVSDRHLNDGIVWQQIYPPVSLASSNSTHWSILNMMRLALQLIPTVGRLEVRFVRIRS